MGALAGVAAGDPKIELELLGLESSLPDPKGDAEAFPLPAGEKSESPRPFIPDREEPNAGADLSDELLSTSLAGAGAVPEGTSGGLSFDGVALPSFFDTGVGAFVGSGGKDEEEMVFFCSGSLLVFVAGVTLFLDVAGGAWRLSS